MVLGPQLTRWRLSATASHFGGFWVAASLFVASSTFEMGRQSTSTALGQQHHAAPYFANSCATVPHLHAFQAKYIALRFHTFLAMG